MIALAEGNRDEWLAQLPIGQVWGIGRAHEARLLARTIKTALDFALMEPNEIRASTMPANTEISRIHNRTPVFIEESDWERYLDPEPLTDDEKHRMISTPSEGTFRFWPVATKAVGSELLREIPLDDPTLPQRPIKKSVMEGQAELF